MMTVAELIAKLEEMPKDAPIELEIIPRFGHSTSTNSDASFEIYESVTDSVIIQAIA
jgi:hypothetical protein